jgi:hypothetical protein
LNLDFTVIGTNWRLVAHKKKRKERSEQNSGTCIGFEALGFFLQAKRMGLAHQLSFFFFLFLISFI